MRTLTLLSAFVFLTSCTASQMNTYSNVEKTVATVLISDAQEDELGRQIHNELDTPTAEKPALKYVVDPQINGYVEGLIAKLIPHADKDRPSKWHVYVIDDPKTVNAFATPGAQIYVYTGLLLTAANEAEVIGVLGHELGHVVARHSARQLVNAYGINAISSVALGKDPGTAAQIAAAIVGNGTMLAHSRSDENEADTYAVKYSAAANYDAAGIAGFACSGNALQSLRSATCSRSGMSAGISGDVEFAEPET